MERGEQVIQFTIPGEPYGKGRPRMNRYTGAVYTPTETKEYEKRVRAAYYAATSGVPGFEKCPVRVEVRAYFAIPTGVTIRLREAMERGDVKPEKKPDCDNILKIICDALNGVAYYDDKQVVLATVSKHWAHIPRVEVTLKEAEA